MRFRSVLVLGFLSLLLGRAGAIEIGVEAQMGNIHFPWTATTPTAGTASFPTTNYFWGGSTWASFDLGEDYALKVSYDRDPVLRNSVSGIFQFERGVARIGVGPFIGFLNGDGKILSAGLSTALRLQWPGLAFVSARSDGGLSLGLVADLASIPQTSAELSAGFYTKNAIVSAIVSGKRFSETNDSGKLVADNLTLYALTVDIYKKNVPFQVLTMAGYQVRSKYYQAEDVTDALGSVILGATLSVQATSALKLVGTLSTGVFTFGLDELAGRSPSANSFMFDASLGVVVDLGLLRKKERETKSADLVDDAVEESEAPADQ